MAAAVLVAGFGAVPTQALQQTGPGPDAVDEVLPVNEYQLRLDRAVALEGLAREASQDMKTFSEAARMYREAADLRGKSPEAVENLIQAAHLSFYMGDEARAVAGLSAAAKAARSWDDVATAADTFLDAAWVAQARGWTRRAIRLASEAEELTHSELMTSAHRHQILERIADMQE
jgi:hypothetical protein